MGKSQKLTKQGVPDLNDLGKKRINGKRRACIHFIDDIFVKYQKEVTDSYGETRWVNILACDACDEIIGPETEFEVV